MYKTFFHPNVRKERPNFLTFFPPPDFLSMRTLGFDISDNSIKLVEFIKDRGQMVLGFYASSDIPAGTIQSGQIMNYTGLQKVITELQRRHKFIFVDASLPEEKAYLFTTTIDGDADVAMRENIEFHLEENIPLAKTEVVFDFKVYKTYTKAGKKYHDVIVSAVSRSVSESYVGLLKRSGLRPLSLSIEAEAIANAVVPRDENGTYLVVDLGRSRTGVSVVSETVIQLTSTIEVGGSQLSSLVAEKLRMSKDDAEMLKREYGLLGTSGREGEASEALRDGLSGIVREIDGQLRYWHSKTDGRGLRSRRVSTVLLCGGGALMKGIEAHFKRNLLVDVELANVWINVPFPKDYVPGISFEESLSYAAAVGLALQ
jgi:type IV pilus assembly protein PilM